MRHRDDLAHVGQHDVIEQDIVLKECDDVFLDRFKTLDGCIVDSFLEGISKPYTSPTRKRGTLPESNHLCPSLARRASEMGQQRVLKRPLVATFSLAFLSAIICGCSQRVQTFDGVCEFIPD